jgi:hypothetical protein
LTLNDSQLTLGDGHKMKLDIDPFSVNVNMINFKEKRILVGTSQADTTREKNVIVFDEPRSKMIKPKSPKPGVWKTKQIKGSSRPQESCLHLNCCWKNTHSSTGGVF